MNRCALLVSRCSLAIVRGWLLVVGGWLVEFDVVCWQLVVVRDLLLVVG